MTLQEYIEEVRRTLSPLTTEKTIQLGLIGESGEVADLVKKSLERGTAIDRDRMIEELGDVLWYVAAKLNAYGLTDVDPDGVDFRFRSACDSAVLLSSACAALGRSRYPFEVQTFAPAVIGHVLSIYAEVEPAGPGATWLSDLRAANIAKLRRRHPEGFEGASRDGADARVKELESERDAARAAVVSLRVARLQFDALSAALAKSEAQLAAALARIHELEGENAALGRGEVSSANMRG